MKRTLLSLFFLLSPFVSTEAAIPPNIIVIFASDMGYMEPSVYNGGKLQFKTPNIDRIAREGGYFTNYYAQQSSLAGRGAFITGQSPFRTGLLKEDVSKAGLREEDPTLADILQGLGYATFQVGKSLMGTAERNLPTHHGFDHFYGSLTHLEARELPSNTAYKPYLNYSKQGVVNCYMNKANKQYCVDTGPLTIERTQTINDELVNITNSAMEASKKNGQPFFIWHSFIRKHIPRHFNAHYYDRLFRESFLAVKNIEFDDTVGAILKQIDILGIADNTIVIVTTDNGPEILPYGAGGTEGDRGERNTFYEARYRVPAVIRWPRVVAPGSVFKGIVSHEDWMPTLSEAAGVPDISTKLLSGYYNGSKNFRAHLDGYNMKDYLALTAKNPRREFFYWTEQGDLGAIRIDDRKFEFMEQKERINNTEPGPLVPRGAFITVDQGPDANPYEQSQSEPGDSYSWFYLKAELLPPAANLSEKYVKSFVTFPARASSPKFGLEEAIRRIDQAIQ